MEYRNQPMFTVKLYGSLKRRFGSGFKMSAHSPAAAIRGYGLQVPEFGKAIVEGTFHVLRGEKLKGAFAYTEDNVGALAADDQTIHVIPVAAGAKGGFFGVIVGVVIMVAAVIASPFTGGTSFAAAMAAESALFGITYGAIFMFGLGITLLGVAQMTAKTQVGNMDMRSAEDNASAVMSGPQNVAKQGVAVPLIYGKTMVGSIMVASNLTAVDYEG